MYKNELKTTDNASENKVMCMFFVNIHCFYKVLIHYVVIV